MKYVVSDIHGCYDKYKMLLGRIGLKDEDTLFVLGDAVDRGNGGIEILLDMFERPNVVPLMGNHDYSALNILPMMENGLTNLTGLQRDIASLWLSDGGMVTYEAFMRLGEDERRKIISYLKTFTYFEKAEADGKKFFLAHTVPEKEFFLDKEDQSVFDYLTGEPDYDKVYDEDMYIVTGHTPTELIDPAFAGRIWKGNGHIAVDCGAAFGNPLGCVRLDTLEEIYVG